MLRRDRNATVRRWAAVALADQAFIAKEELRPVFSDRLEEEKHPVVRVGLLSLLIRLGDRAKQHELAHMLSFYATKKGGALTRQVVWAVAASVLGLIPSLEEATRDEIVKCFDSYPELEEITKLVHRNERIGRE